MGYVESKVGSWKGVLTQFQRMESVCGGGGGDAPAVFLEI